MLEDATENGYSAGMVKDADTLESVVSGPGSLSDALRKASITFHRWFIDGEEPAFNCALPAYLRDAANLLAGMDAKSGEQWLRERGHPEPRCASEPEPDWLVEMIRRSQVYYSWPGGADAHRYITLPATAKDALLARLNAPPAAANDPSGKAFQTLRARLALLASDIEGHDIFGGTRSGYAAADIREMLGHLESLRDSALLDADIRRGIEAEVEEAQQTIAALSDKLDRARAPAPAPASSSASMAADALSSLWSWVMQAHPDEFVDWLIAKKTPGFDMDPPDVWRARYREVLSDVSAALSTSPQMEEG